MVDAGHAADGGRALYVALVVVAGWRSPGLHPGLAQCAGGRIGSSGARVSDRFTPSLAEGGAMSRMSQGKTTKRTRRTKGTGRRKADPRRWSRRVAEQSDSLDLEAGVFRQDDPRRIARSLKRSAERSTRRKAKPFPSAMSMLNLYINRAGRTLPARRRRMLERTKDELRAAFGRGG